MAFQEGDIVCVKTTGERVFVRSLDTSTATVRRAIVGEFGIAGYEEVKFDANEVETIKDHASRQVSEMILKAEAQKDLIKAESKIQAELEADVELTTPAPKRSDPTVN